MIPISKNKEFIEYYYNTTTNIDKSKDVKYNFNESIKQASINLSKLFELVINLSEKGDQDACNFIRWNFHISLGILNSQAKCGDQEILRKQKSLFSQLEKKFESLVKEKANQVNRAEFNTKLNEVKRKVKKIIQQLVKLYSGVIEAWPFYYIGLNVDTSEFENEIEQLNQSIENILKEAKLDTQRAAINKIYELSLELFKNEKSLGETQFSQIIIALSIHNEKLKQTIFNQIVDRCGEQYDILKVRMSQLMENAISLKNLLVSTILHPIEFFKNVCYALSNIKKVAKECGNFIKNNPCKSALFVAGAIGIGIGFGFITAGLAPTAIGVATFNIVVASHTLGVGATSLLSASAVASVAGSVIKTVESEANQQLIESFSENEISINNHAEAISVAKKAYFDKINKNTQSNGNETPAATEIKEEQNIVLKTRELTLQLIIQTEDNLELLEKEEESINESNNELSVTSNNLNEKVKQANEELLRATPIEAQNDNTLFTKEYLQPLFQQWLSVFAGEGSFDKITFITTKFKDGEYEALFDWFEMEQILYQPDKTPLE